MSNNLIKYFLILFFICCQLRAELIPVTELFTYSEYNDIELSPDGKYILASTSNSDFDSVVIAERTQTKPTLLFKIQRSEESGVLSMEWIDADTLYLLFLKSNDKIERRFYDIRIESDQIKFESRKIKTPGWIVDTLQDIDDEVLYAQFINEKRGTFLYKVNVETLQKANRIPSRYRIAKDADKARLFFTDKDHNVRMVANINGDRVVYKYKNLKMKSWKEALVLNRSKNDKFTPVTFLPNDIVVALTNYERDKVAVVKYDLRAKKTVEIVYESSNYDINKFEVDPLTNELQSVTYLEKGQPHKIFFSQTESELSKLLSKAFPDKNISTISKSVDNNHSIIMVTSSDYPGGYYYVNKKTRKVRPIGDRYAKLNQYKYSKSKKILLSSDDGFNIEGWLTPPVGTNKNYPLLVLVHGGPMGVRDKDTFNKEVQFLANRGFGVLRVNFRGSGGYGKEFLESGKAQWGEAIERDIHLIVEYAVKHYPINKEKMCIMGHSYGGYSAIMAAILYPELYQCAISSFGVSDISLLHSGSNLTKKKERRKKIDRVLGDLSYDEEKLRKLSPVYQAEKITIPILLMAGAQDATSYWENVHRMHFVLEELGKQHDYVVYPTAYHGHAYWTGDQHQYAYIAFYLQSKLGIKPKWIGKDAEIYTKELDFVAFEFKKPGSFKNRLVKYDAELAEKILVRDKNLRE